EPFDWPQPITANGLRSLADGKQFGHGRSVNIGIEDADLQSKLAQRQREIDGRGRLADPAFAGGDCDDGRHSRNARRRRCRWTSGWRTWTRSRRRRYLRVRRGPARRPPPPPPPPPP